MGTQGEIYVMLAALLPCKQISHGEYDAKFKVGTIIVGDEDAEDKDDYIGVRYGYNGEQELSFRPQNYKSYWTEYGHDSADKMIVGYALANESYCGHASEFKAPTYELKEKLVGEIIKRTGIVVNHQDIKLWLLYDWRQ